jgi:pimeloyl-ACP methyl ester carboxylesterase
MGDRVLGLGLLSVIGPLDGRGALDGTNLPVRTAYWLARRAPRVLGSVVSSMVRAAERNPDKAFARLARTRPAEDREVVLRPDVRRVLMQNLAGQFRDAASIVREFRLAVQPWPVALDRIAVPTHIWQGGRDDVHTPAMARRLASAIPNAHLTLRPEFATFNFLDDLEPMLTTICGWFEPPGRPPARGAGAG